MTFFFFLILCPFKVSPGRKPLFCVLRHTQHSAGHSDAQWNWLKEVNSRVPYLGDVRVIFEPIGHAPVSPHIQGIARGFGSVWAYCTGTQIIQVIINIKYRKFVELSGIG